MTNEDERILVAPCGMYCGVCRAYLAYSRHIPREKGKVSHCAGCRIRRKKCAYLKGRCPQLNSETSFCFECADFPCSRLKMLDKRYRTRYQYSPISNLERIKQHGLDFFLRQQRERFRCPECGGTLSVHDGRCYDCQTRNLG